jgi:hypothetical protein
MQMQSMRIQVICPGSKNTKQVNPGHIGLACRSRPVTVG